MIPDHRRMPDPDQGKYLIASVREAQCASNITSLVLGNRQASLKDATHSAVSKKF